MRSILWNAGLAAKGIRAEWRALDAFRGQSGAEARAELGRRLLAQLQHFGSRADALPEWREAARLRHPEEVWDAWGSLPILGKRDLATRFDPARIQAEHGVRGRVSSTGGSTGEPTPFLHDAAQQAWGTASWLYCWHRMGWRPGMPVVCVWGSERDIGRHRSLTGLVGLWLRNVSMVDGYALDDATVDEVLRLLRARRGSAVYGFTSMLEFVARRVLERGEAVPRGAVRTAWNGGEMLSEAQSDLFRQAFGVPILNYYGGRELGAMAYQREAGGPLEVLRPGLFLEIVDDAGRPAAPEEPGRLVWTSTVGRGTPFLRYDIGDLGTYRAEDADESGIRRIAELHGRTAGLLRLPNGRTINGLYWNHLFKDFGEVEQFQVAWIGERRLELRLRGRRASPEREAHLRGVVTRFVGPEVPLTISWVERIALTEQGKLMQVVREPERVA